VLAGHINSKGFPSFVPTGSPLVFCPSDNDVSRYLQLKRAGAQTGPMEKTKGPMSWATALPNSPTKACPARHVIGPKDSPPWPPTGKLHVSTLRGGSHHENETAEQIQGFVSVTSVETPNQSNQGANKAAYREDFFCDPPI
jgi:hypothetical protein